MGCCGEDMVRQKAIKTEGEPNKVSNMVEAYYRHPLGKPCAYTDDRIRVCQKCEKNYWLGRTLWCSVDNRFVPNKAAIEETKCPENKWAK